MAEGGKRIEVSFVTVSELANARCEFGWLASPRSYRASSIFSKVPSACSKKSYTILLLNSRSSGSSSISRTCPKVVMSKRSESLRLLSWSQWCQRDGSYASAFMSLRRGQSPSFPYLTCIRLVFFCSTINLSVVVRLEKCAWQRRDVKRRRYRRKALEMVE